MAQDANNGGKEPRAGGISGINVIVVIFFLFIVYSGVSAIYLLAPHFEQPVSQFNETICLTGWNGNGKITTATSCCTYCHETTNATFGYKRYVSASTYQRSLCLCQREDFTIYEVEGL